MDILSLPGYANESHPDPYATGPIRVRALLTTLGLITGSPQPGPAPERPGWHRFATERGAVELVCDDPIALARAAGIFARYDSPTSGPTWRVTLNRVRSLDAAPSAFVATPEVDVDDGVRARHHQCAALGDSWWIAAPQIVIHHGRRSRWVGARYVEPAAARFWASRLVGRVLTAQSVTRGDVG